MHRTTSDRWITRPRPTPGARLRLFCLPHAGAGASVFRNWAEALPAEVEVCPVQLPGRENRIAEPAIDRVPPLVEALTDAVSPWLDRPFAVLGHSNGAMIGFELVRELRRRGRPGPLHLFASGRRAPDVAARTPPIHQCPDDVFIAELKALGGMPDALLEHPELIELLVPLLRADVALHETYAFVEEPPLETPITAYRGETDPKVTLEDVEAWARHTRGPFTLRTFPGGHFFLQDDRASFLRTLSADLAPLAAAAPAG